MAAWSRLRSRLANVEGQLTLSWAELDTLVGGLPPSAHQHRAFWAGDRSMWKGFRATHVAINHEVTFVRHLAPKPTDRDKGVGVLGKPEGAADLVLIGCVKSKLDHPAPAKDLYTSALFHKERAYAQSSGKPWFILSAKHGLVSPDEVLEPYDVYLKETTAAYRVLWGATVVEQLAEAFGPVQGARVEIHASAAYVDPIRSRLEADGAHLLVPLSGLGLGKRLAWYEGPRNAAVVGAVAQYDSPHAQVDQEVAGRLLRYEGALSPQEFIATGGRGLRHPGLYSWWVDPIGAATLSAGLGHHIEPGLIYAGLAGATRTRSGKASGNTLWGRIRGMHLGGHHEFSTFRRSLGSILASALDAPGIDEVALTAWMFEHLHVVAVPVADAETLDDLETTVLTQLNPPLNLMKMPKTPIRKRLSELRRQCGAGTSFGIGDPVGS
jgi:hypothetical protein